MVVRMEVARLPVPLWEAQAEAGAQDRAEI